MVEKRVGPQERRGKNAKARSLSHSLAHSLIPSLAPSVVRFSTPKHDRDDRDEGGNGPVPEMTRSERSEKCAKRLNNEQLNCNCTATGFALSRVCILIGILSTIRSVSNWMREPRHA